MDKVIDHRLYDQGMWCVMIVDVIANTQSEAAVKWFVNKVDTCVLARKKPAKEELSYLKDFVATLVANQTTDVDFENGEFFFCCIFCGFHDVRWTCRRC